MFRRLLSRRSESDKRLAEEIELLHDSPLIDPVWYRQTYADLRDTPIDVARHYLEHGAVEGRNPCPLFDTKFYLEQNPDVAASGINPLVHFIKYGLSERRDPNPLFDTNWYLRQNKEVEASRVNPLVHYLTVGEATGRKPSGLFDPEWYLKTYDDVAQSGLSPLAHYLCHGRRAGRISSRRSSNISNRSGSFDRRLRHIAFVTNEFDRQTMHYRVENYAEAFQKLGVATTIVNWTELQFEAIDSADLLLLCRIAGNQRTHQIIRQFQSLGKPVIYDIDDLVFDVNRLHLLAHYEKLSLTEKAQLNEFAGAIRSTLDCCDIVTTATFALKTEIEKLGLTAQVIPNTIGFGIVEAAREITAAGAGQHDRVRLGYFSGTRTHERDFAECTGALRRILDTRSDVELMVVGELDCPILEQYEDKLIRLPLMPYRAMLNQLATVDINLAPLQLYNPFTNCKSELKVFEASIFGIPTVASPTSGYASIIAHGSDGLLAQNDDEWYNFLSRLIEDVSFRRTLGNEARRTIVPRFRIENAIREAECLYRALLDGAIRRPTNPSISDDRKQFATLPSIAVIAILYKKRNEVTWFLESMRRQSYSGQYEILFVDDKSPDDSAEVANVFWSLRRALPDTNQNMSMRIIRNATNIGNCASRNRAIAESNSDIVVIVDADCIVNHTFLSSHVRSFQAGCCDVSIGPINLETLSEPPLAVWNRFECDWRLADEQAELQDRTNRESFVNCITRNFAVSRAFLASIAAPLFDDLFGYSASPNSGFGWEDVEMGYRLFQAGARIRYLPDTFSLHVSHPATVDNVDKPLRSLRNFRRLHQKHPAIAFESRQWSIRTFKAIVDWANQIKAPLHTNDDYNYLKPIFERYGLAPIAIHKERALRILTYRWHCAHQYELFHLPHEFTLVRGGGTAMCDGWEWHHRPMPRNARFAQFDEIEPRDFDLAILHFDENVLHPEICHGLVPADWGKTLVRALSEWAIPKLGICHGTPQFVGQYDATFGGPDLGKVIDEHRNEIVELMKDLVVVCNSHQAQEEWGFKNSVAIWHGFSPHEYSPGSHNGGVLSMVPAALKNRPHYNGSFINDRVRDLLGPDIPFTHLAVPDPLVTYALETEEWARAKYQNYARELGFHSIYLNPTLRSPMPRSRGEAMMAGLTTVSMNNHDVEMFIRNGINGFFGDTPEELAEYIRYLMNNEAQRVKIGIASRRTAADLFNQDRYLSRWSSLLQRMIS